ncbi:MAG: DegT/DnrJ/EryC1/StrS aminotransferase family protein [Stygiobacter sp.]|nr:MAG: DegT/DnrJ/EryC1/StrS aminotransferase family protein [Stygiobacter sp.]
MIPISGPWISEKEIEFVNDAIKNGWFDKSNYYINEFEKLFCEYTGRKYAIALPSCTSALHLSMLSLGLKNGDEVIVPESTWIATSAPISYVGAKPIFADIDYNSWCIDPLSIEKHITPSTKAIICVDLYGNMPEYSKIYEIAEKRKILLVEDAAQAVGSEYMGKKAGSFGTMSTFSFHGTKTLTTGEGGMLLTDDAEIINKSLYLRDHGRDLGEKMFWNTSVAYKYKMSNLQAALGLAQLLRVEELISRKIEIFNWYEKYLAPINDVTCNIPFKGIKNVPWMTTIVWDNEKIMLGKELLINELKLENISSRPFFYPLSSLPAYSTIIEKDYAKLNPNAYSISRRSINLPSNMLMTEENVIYICEKLKKILDKFRR